MTEEKPKKKSIFESPLLSTKVKSSRTKIFPEGALGYFIGPVLAILSNSVLNNYLNRYFTDVLKLTEWASLFSILLPVISVILVVLGNILVGKLMDHSKTKAGKARPLLLIALPLMVLALFVIFYTPRPVTDNAVGSIWDSSDAIWNLVWIAIGYNLFYSIAYPFYFTSHSALVTLSTRSSKDRSLLATISNATSLAAMGLTSMILPFFIKILFVPSAEDANIIDVEASANAWKILVVVLAVIAVIGILIEYFFTRERITEESFLYEREDEARSKKSTVSTAKQAKACLTDKYWWIMIAFYLFYQLGGMLKNCSQLYFCQAWFPNADGYSVTAGGTVSGTISILGAIPTALGMVIVWPLANKIGKGKAILFGAILSTLGGLIGFIDPSNQGVVFTSFIVKALGSTPAMYISLALLSDVLDHNEAKNGFRSDGLTMTIYGAIMVGMSGIANGIINGLLGFAGYNANTLNSDAAMRANVQNVTKWIFLGGETICYAAIIILFLFMGVEKFVATDHKIITSRQRIICIAEGNEWIEPEERARKEEAEIALAAEQGRISDLKNYCNKKGLDFEKEEAKYQAQQANKAKENEAKKAAKAKAKADKLAAKQALKAEKLAKKNEAELAKLEAECKEKGINFEEAKARRAEKLRILDEAKAFEKEEKAARKEERKAKEQLGIDKFFHVHFIEKSKKDNVTVDELSKKSEAFQSENSSNLEDVNIAKKVKSFEDSIFRQKNEIKADDFFVEDFNKEISLDEEGLTKVSNLVKEKESNKRAKLEEAGKINILNA